MRTGRKQLLVILAALVLTAVLYFLPQKMKREPEAKPQMGFSFEGIMAQAKGQLKPAELEPIKELEARLAKDEGNIILLDSLGKLWDIALFPAVSAHYFEQIAIQKPEEKNWLNAAYRYFDAFKGSTDSLMRSMMVQKAITTYQKVLELNPGNLNAKTDLGLCYAEGTAEPMKGILLLREVIKVDPTHANANFNLGVLSVRSGQLDKAVDRFRKVLAVDSSRVEARYLLGSTLIQMGERARGIRAAETNRKVYFRSAGVGGSK